MVWLNPLTEESLDVQGATGSYTFLMVTVCLANLLQFFMRPAIYRDEKKPTLNELKEKDVHKINDLDSKENSEAVQTHYVWMERKFERERMWTWIINLVAYVAMIISYFMIDGKEMVYCLYLPLDLAFNLCKAAFFFLHLLIENYNKSKEEKLIKALRMQQLYNEL